MSGHPLYPLPSFVQVSNSVIIDSGFQLPHFCRDFQRIYSVFIFQSPNSLRVCSLFLFYFYVYSQLSRFSLLIFQVPSTPSQFFNFIIRFLPCNSQNHFCFPFTLFFKFSLFIFRCLQPFEDSISPCITSITFLIYIFHYSL
jgi:hypothetical protein